MRFLSLLLLLPLLTGCLGGPPEPPPAWQASEIAEVPSDHILWKAALYSCHKMGFSIATGLDPSTMEMTTAWRNNLHPFSNRGTRTQAHVVMTPQGRDTWLIEARVKQQINESMRDPLDPRAAEWKWIGDDTDAARILVHHIRAYLAPAIKPTERPTDEIDAILEQLERDTE